MDVFESLLTWLVLMALEWTLKMVRNDFGEGSLRRAFHELKKPQHLKRQSCCQFRPLYGKKLNVRIEHRQRDHCC